MSFRGQRFAVLSLVVGLSMAAPMGAVPAHAADPTAADVQWAQMILKAKGLYSGRANGDFNEPTRDGPARVSEVGRSEADWATRRRHVRPYAGRAPVHDPIHHGQSGGAERQAAALPGEPQRRTAEAAGVADHQSRYPRIGHGCPGAGRHRAFGSTVGRDNRGARSTERSAAPAPFAAHSQPAPRPVPAPANRPPHRATPPPVARPPASLSRRPHPGPASIPSVRRHLKESGKLPIRLKPASRHPLGCVR